MASGLEVIDKDLDTEQEDDTSNKANRFCVDYSKRGTAKCKICKKCIPKDELRIGVNVLFKGKLITSYHHVTCSFQKMKRARSPANTITCMDDIIGYDLIKDKDRLLILQLMDEVNAKKRDPPAETLAKKNHVQEKKFYHHRK